MRNMYDSCTGGALLHCFRIAFDSCLSICCFCRFQDAGSFDQDLCPWSNSMSVSPSGNIVPIVSAMFQGTSCFNTSDPVFDDTIGEDGAIDPLCEVCLTF